MVQSFDNLLRLEVEGIQNYLQVLFLCLLTFLHYFGIVRSVDQKLARRLRRIPLQVDDRQLLGLEKSIARVEAMLASLQIQDKITPDYKRSTSLSTSMRSRSTYLKEKSQGLRSKPGFRAFHPQHEHRVASREKRMFLVRHRSRKDDRDSTQPQGMTELEA